MDFLRKLLFSSEFLPLVIVLALGFMAGRVLLTPGYFNMHDDLQMMRQLEMEKCFKDFQIPCRWVPDMGYGYGFPLFNYYPPLPYLIGEGIRLFGFTFVDTVKLTFFLSIVVSGVTMYLLAKDLWGRIGGVLSSAFYIWAPYHAVDVYVRGAMNESWALSWFPLVMWSAYRLITSSRSFGWIIALSLSWFALLTSHNLMVIIFTPIFSAWCLFWLWRQNAWHKIPQLIISGLWSLGLAAFFSLPVVIEQKFVQIDTLTKGYYEYVAHFATVNQLFISNFWGYGASVWQEEDKMAFPIGYFHWGLALLIAALVAILILLRRRKHANTIFIVSMFLIFGFFTAFMSHVRSTPIWLAFPTLKIVQFPWRFLTLVIFSFSLISGALVPLLSGIISEKKNKDWLLIPVTLLTVAILVFNKDYFRPEKMGSLTDSEKFSAAAWELQQTAGIYDYLPTAAKIAPQGPRGNPIDVVEGETVASDIKEGTNWLKAIVNVETEKTLLRINIFDFPNWKVFIDGKETDIKKQDNDELARIHIEVPKGEHKIEARFFNTPFRTVANIISLFSWFLLVVVLWKKKTSLARIRK